MENRIAELTAEIDALKEQFNTEQKLTEIYKQGKEVGAEMDALIKGLKASGLDDVFVTEIVKAGIRQGIGGVL